MKSLIIFFIILAFMLFSCAKSDSSGEKQETKSTTAVVQTDSVIVDSAISDLQKSVDELKNDAEDLQKTVDDLLK